jgi:hypothetical protein
MIAHFVAPKISFKNDNRFIVYRNLFNSFGVIYQFVLCRMRTGQEKNGVFPIRSPLPHSFTPPPHHIRSHPIRGTGQLTQGQSTHGQLTHRQLTHKDNWLTDDWLTDNWLTKTTDSKTIDSVRNESIILKFSSLTHKFKIFLIDNIFLIDKNLLLTEDGKIFSRQNLLFK